MTIDKNGRAGNNTEKIFSSHRSQKYPPDTKSLKIPVFSFSLSSLSPPSKYLSLSLPPPNISLSLALSEVQNVDVPFK